jgi:hypothetical protein
VTFVSLFAGTPEDPATALRSSMCGMSHEAKNAIATIGVATTNTVWIDSA